MKEVKLMKKLRSTNHNYKQDYGIVGTLTPLQTCYGAYLNVGDIVTLADPNTHIGRPQAFVVNRGDDTFCIMGYGHCDFVKGCSTDGKWIIAQVIPYQHLIPSAQAGKVEMYDSCEDSKVQIGNLTFAEAFIYAKDGYQLTLPEWDGCWTFRENVIYIHTRDGEVVKFTDTKNLDYTLSFILYRNDWIVSDE